MLMPSWSSLSRSGERPAAGHVWVAPLLVRIEASESLDVQISPEMIADRASSSEVNIIKGVKVRHSSLHSIRTSETTAVRHTSLYRRCYVCYL